MKVNGHAGKGILNPLRTSQGQACSLESQFQLYEINPFLFLIKISFESVLRFEELAAALHVTAPRLSFSPLQCVASQL